MISDQLLHKVDQIYLNKRLNYVAKKSMKVTRANNMASEVENLLNDKERRQEAYRDIARKEAEILLNARMNKLKISNKSFNPIALNPRST